MKQSQAVLLPSDGVVYQDEESVVMVMRQARLVVIKLQVADCFPAPVTSYSNRQVLLTYSLHGTHSLCALT